MNSLSKLASIKVFSLALLCSVSSFAQPLNDNGQGTAVTPDVQMSEEKTLEIPPFKKDEYASLVFTEWEHEAIEIARKRRGGSVRGASDDEIYDSFKRSEDLIDQDIPEMRDISLGGILYKKQGDWTIWLNGNRVTPDALPIEALELRVHEKYIEIEWFDEYTKQIFPIRLRPHQRFNMDARIFLPG
tara:strand:+ start:10196 stop:10756 length:561 start_codon:yes stop_codon:yes gene_type:complete